jgi:hypothetical protein
MIQRVEFPLNSLEHLKVLSESPRSVNENLQPRHVPALRGAEDSRIRHPHCEIRDPRSENPKSEIAHASPSPLLISVRIEKTCFKNGDPFFSLGS